MADVALAPIFISAVALLLSLTVHEAAHAWAADRLGDSTARLLGRISLNPLVHIDLVGTVLLPLVAMVTGAPIIGWAKPVPVNMRHLRQARRDFMLIAAAGPASNILLAVLASVGLRLLRAAPEAPSAFALAEPVGAFGAALFQINLLLAVFNLLPVPPLDGGNILAGLLRGAPARYFDAVRTYGVFILYALMFSGVLSQLIGPPFYLLARLLTL